MVKRTMTEIPEREQPAFVGALRALGYHWGVKPAGPSGQDQHYKDHGLPAQDVAKAKDLNDDAKFDAILIDEVQDFADFRWDAIWAMAKNPDAFYLAVFRDDSQSVVQDRLGRPDIPLARMRAHRCGSQYGRSVRTWARARSG